MLLLEAQKPPENGMTLEIFKKVLHVLVVFFAYFQITGVVSQGILFS